MNDAEPIVRFVDVNVTYRGSVRALRGLNLSINRGERIAIVGESGCGKTTLLRTLLGLLPRGTTITGQVLFEGNTDLVKASERKLRAVRGRLIGYVPQNPMAAFDPLYSVLGHTREAWSCHGVRISEESIAGMLRDVGIVDPERSFRQRPSSWSGGMLQRASIVAATAHRPPLLVADEPTSALDRPLARRVLDMLAERSETLVVVTHDLDLIDGVADRTIVLYGGRIVEDRQTADLLAWPKHPYTRALLNSLPRTGQLPAELPGDPPQLAGSTSGCSFVPRCPKAFDRCSASEPALVDGVACFAAEGGST